LTSQWAVVRKPDKTWRLIETQHRVYKHSR